MQDIVEHLSNPHSELFKSLWGTNGTPRPAQIEYASAMTRLLAEDGAIGAFQAETGTGKTLGYLAPAMLRSLTTRERIIVSTQTIQLQQQILSETIPGLSEYFAKIPGGRKLRACRRIGKRNFISMPSLISIHERMVEETPGDAQTQLVGEILDWLDQNPHRAIRQDVEDVHGLSLSETQLPARFWRQIEIGQYPGDDELYLQSVDESRDADIVVINHSLLVLDLMTKGRVLFNERHGRAKRESILIIDEADALPDIALQMCTRNLPLGEITAVASRMAMPKNERNRLKKITTELDAIFDAIAETAAIAESDNKRPSYVILGTPETKDTGARLLPLLEGIHDVYEKADANDHGDEVEISEIRNVTMDLEHVIDQLNASRRGDATRTKCAMYWTPIQKRPGLHVDGQNYKSLLWRLLESEETAPAKLLFTSATLTGSQNRANMSSFATQMGVGPNSNAIKRFRFESFAPQNFGKMTFAVIDQTKAPPVMLRTDDEDAVTTNTAILPWWSGMIQKAHREGGRVLVLTPSHSDAKAIYDEVRTNNELRCVLIDQRGDQNANIKAFIANEDAILISTSRWAGLNLPGLIKHIVIPRIPRNPPNLIYDALLEDALQKRGIDVEAIKKKRHPASIAAARRKFQQGIGRGIRTHTDDVKIWIGDPRWPLTDAQKLRSPTTKPTWVDQMKSAIPQRFMANANKPTVFSLDVGTDHHAPPAKERKLSKAATFMKTRPRAK